MNGPLLASNQTLIRASSTNNYADCPRRWAARNIAAEIRSKGYLLHERPSSIGAAVGTAVHAGAAVSLDEKARTGELAPIDVACDAAIDALDENLKGGVLIDDVTRNRNDAEVQVKQMVRVYRQNVAPQISPVMVETRLEANFSIDLVVSGKSDVVAREPGRLRDLKTGKRRYECKPQLGIYALLAQTYRYSIAEVVEDWIKRVPVSKPQPAPVSFRHDLAEATSVGIATLRHIQRDLKTFREGDDEVRLARGDPAAFLANPNSVMCSANYCPAHGTTFCKEWKKD